MIRHDLGMTLKTRLGYDIAHNMATGKVKCEEVLAIRRIFSLVDMITNTKFSNCPNVFFYSCSLAVKYA